MSKIIATHNIDTEAWEVESDFSTSHCDLYFKFINNNNLEITNLEFGYTLYQRDINVEIQSGQLLENLGLPIALTLGFNVDYKLKLWVNNISKITEYDFSTPQVTG